MLRACLLQCDPTSNHLQGRSPWLDDGGSDSRGMRLGCSDTNGVVSCCELPVQCDVAAEDSLASASPGVAPASAVRPPGCHSSTPGVLGLAEGGRSRLTKVTVAEGAEVDSAAGACTLLSGGACTPTRCCAAAAALALPLAAAATPAGAKRDLRAAGRAGPSSASEEGFDGPSGAPTERFSGAFAGGLTTVPSLAIVLDCSRPSGARRCPGAMACRCSRSRSKACT